MVAPRPVTVSSSLPASQGAVLLDALRAGPQARRDSPAAAELRELDARVDPVSFQDEAVAEQAVLPDAAVPHVVVPHAVAQPASSHFVACPQQVELGELLAGRAQVSRPVVRDALARALDSSSSEVAVQLPPGAVHDSRQRTAPDSLPPAGYGPPEPQPAVWAARALPPTPREWDEH
jgi:hypothetical protein